MTKPDKRENKGTFKPFVNITNCVFVDLIDSNKRIINALNFGERTLEHDENTVSGSKFSSINDAKIYLRAISHITETIETI